MSSHNITCVECDERLSDYFEREINASSRLELEGHAASCARCAALIRDIDSIRNEAGSLSDIVPSRDLWQGIEARIQPAVVPVGIRRESMGLSRGILGLAAAALIIVSSSITYVATRTVGTDKRPARVAETSRNSSPRSLNDEIPSKATGVTVRPAPVEKAAPAPDVPRSGSPNTARGTSSPVAALASATTAPESAAELALAPEIARLQQTLRFRRDQLDPATVQVVEDNLKLIDAALAQARAALARDPASGFLTERLDDVLQKKIQLLRTVNLLPSRS